MARFAAGETRARYAVGETPYVRVKLVVKGRLCSPTEKQMSAFRVVRCCAGGGSALGRA
jgi:hypothetical protein